MSLQQNNPYAKAAGTYSKQAKETPDQRELEGQVLLKAANELQRLYDRWDEAQSEDIEAILNYNRKLWMVFFDSTIEAPPERPSALNNNIVNLCNYVFRRSINIMAEPAREKLRVLIDINREVAAGLMTRPQGQQAAQPEQAANAPTPPPAGSVETKI